MVALARGAGAALVLCTGGAFYLLAGIGRLRAAHPPPMHRIGVLSVALGLVFLVVALANTERLPAMGGCLAAWLVFSWHAGFALLADELRGPKERRWKWVMHLVVAGPMAVAAVVPLTGALHDRGPASFDEPVAAVAISADDHLLAVISEEGRTTLWNLETRARLWRIEKLDESFSPKDRAWLVFSPDAEYLVWTTRAAHHLLSTTRGETIARLKCGEGDQSRPVFTRNGALLVARENGGLCSWKVDQRSETSFKETAQARDCRDLSSASREHNVWALCGDQLIRWNAESGERELAVRCTGCDLAYEPDGGAITAVLRRRLGDGQEPPPYDPLSAREYDHRFINDVALHSVIGSFAGGKRWLVQGESGFVLDMQSGKLESIDCYRGQLAVGTMRAVLAGCSREGPPPPVLQIVSTTTL